ncbi:MAG: PAS domain S-box protein [Chloroflexi bacterium]|nr:MAG: PAS domain S-box protein [Chloroflexota bacterium]
MTPLHNHNTLHFSPINTRVALRTTFILVVYIIIFTGLDRLAREFQIYPNVVAWYPPDGVSFALLLALGGRFAPVLVVTSLISSLLVYRISGPIELVVGWGILISVVYGVTAAFLRQRVRFDPQLKSTRDVIWLIGSSAIVSAILAIIAISGNPPTGVISVVDKLIAMITWWIGEMVGLLVMTPFLLIHVMPLVKKFANGTLDLSGKQNPFPPLPRNTVARAITLLIVLFLAFGVPSLKSFQSLYLIAIPLIWLSLDYGIKGASIGIMFISFATIGAIWLFHSDLTQLTAVQLLMLVLSVTSLLLGVVRTEQIQTTRGVGKSEKRFRALVEHSMEEVSLVGMDGTLLFESPTRHRPLGYPPNSLVGGNILDLLHPDDRSAAIELLARVKEQPGSQREALFRLRHYDGSWRWMEGVVTNLLDEPAVGAMVINYRDVTERKRAEETLRASEDRYRDLVDNSHDLICTHDLEGRILSVNPYAEQCLGYTSDTLLQMNIRDLLAPESQKLFHIYLHRMRTRGFDEGIMVIQTMTGEKRIWEYKNSLRTEGVSTPVVRGMARDITERKQAGEQVQARTAELLTLYELSRSLADADGLDEILQHVNRHAVDSIHTTFARIALLEGNKFIIQSAYPIRVLDHDLHVGQRVPVELLPHCQRVMQEKKPVVFQTSNREIGSEERAALLLDFAQSVCLIPLRMGGSVSPAKQALGLLMLGEARSEAREPFTPEKLRLAESIGDQAAVAIRRMLLYEQTERRLQYLTALREIDQAITSSFGLSLSMDALLTQVINQLNVDATSVWLYNPDTDVLEYSIGRGFRTRVFEQAKPLRRGEGNAGRACSEQRTIHIPDLMAQQDNPRLMKALQSEAFVTYFGVPLISKGDIKGVLEVFHRTSMEPDEDWLDFLHTLAGQAALAIDNATLFDNLLRSNYELGQAYNATIVGWSAALDLRDKETEGHTQRVTEMTVRLAKRMGFSKRELVHVRRGALLHDIGKMGVPDRILLKPDKLTEAEWEIMRMHPTHAYQMLKPITYLGPALDIPYSHHEKWDGTGYPQGLKGEAIPLAARIFAAVDVYDALTSDRPYRAGWPKEKVLEHIRSLRGSHFDPQVVEAFLKMLT